MCMFCRSACNTTLNPIYHFVKFSLTIENDLLITNFSKLAWSCVKNNIGVYLKEKQCSNFD